MTRALTKLKEEGRGIATQPQTADAVMAMIERAAKDPAFDVAKMESLMKMKERYDAEAARKAFVRALAQFKENPPIVFKKKKVEFKETKYKHATLGDASAIIGAALSKFGLSHRWKAEQRKAEGIISVTCVLTHDDGHSESVTLEGPYDQSGGKNAIQAIVSAKTYLERHTLFAVTGLAAQDEDDDGKGAGKPPAADKIAGPKGGKGDPEAPTKGTDTFAVKIPCLFGKPPTLEFRGPSTHQKYRIEEAAAKTAKANFKDGDTAVVAWELRDGVKHAVNIDRKAVGADPSQF